MKNVNLLSSREQQVLNLLLQGKSNKLIAHALGISIRTVEFHLKNIYTKYQVNTRLELVLKLTKTQDDQPGYSTVVFKDLFAENIQKSKANEDPKMMKLLYARQVLIGVAAALLIGICGLTVLYRFGHASISALAPWVLPLFAALTLPGMTVGLIGKLTRNTGLRIFISSLFGTGTGAVLMLPVPGFVIYPAAKFAIQLGLINRPAIPTSVTEVLLILAMIMVWSVGGVIMGILPLVILPRRRGIQIVQEQAA